MTHLGIISGPRMEADGPTLPSLLAARAAKHGSAVALLHKRHGIWHRMTWNELDSQVSALARALVAHGVAAGERVVIAGANRPRLLAGLLAAQRAGAVPVLVPQSGAGVPLATAMAETTPRVALVAGVHEVDALRPAPPATVVYDDGRGLGGERQPWLVGWDTFVDAPASLRPAAGPDVRAAIVYVPDRVDGFRAVALSHASLTAAAPVPGVGAADRILAALPFGWGAPLLLGPVLALQTGASLGFPESDATVLTDLREFGPTFLAGPASLFRRMRQIAWTEAGAAGPLGRWLFQRGLGLAAPDGRPNRLAAALIRGPARDQFGLTKLRLALSYGETVPARIAAFWAALGIQLTGFTTPAELDSSGLAEPDTVPAKVLRSRLRGSPYIRDAWLVVTQDGDLAALLALDSDTVATWAQSQGLAVRSIDALAAEERIHALIVGEIDAAAAPNMRITAYSIATTGFDAASSETTPEGWLRPAIVERAHADALRRLRGGGGGRPVVMPFQPEPEWTHLDAPVITAAFFGYGI